MFCVGLLVKMIQPMIDFILYYSEELLDGKYIDYLTKVRVMTGPCVVEVLNKCSSHIDKDKCYLEVGIHRGSTLIGAALNNSAMFYGVDNFSGHNNIWSKYLTPQYSLDSRPASFSSYLQPWRIFFAANIIILN